MSLAEIGNSLCRAKHLWENHSCMHVAAKAASKYSRGAFLGGLGVTTLVCGIAFFLIYHWEQDLKVSPAGWWALGAAAVALLLKMCLSDLAQKKFEWHKHGHDMCIMTLGTSLSALAYAFASDDFPRAQLRPLGVLFILAMIVTILTAGNSREIEEGAAATPTQKCAGLRTANIVVGVFAIMMNLYVLVLKDEGTPKHVPSPTQAAQLIGGVL
jgi:hypothetical protein